MSLSRDIITAVTSNEPAVIQQQEQNKGQFLSIWKQLAHEKKLTKYDMAFYCMSKAVHEFKRSQLLNDPNTQGPFPTARSLAIKFLQQCFTPVTKPKQLASGRKPYGTLYEALYWSDANYELRTSLPNEDLNEIAKIAEYIRGFRYGEVNLL